MADIDLERRRGGGTGWLWGLLGVIVLALIVWWAWPDGNETGFAEEPVEQVEPAAAPAPMPETPTPEPSTFTLGQVLMTPDRYIDTPFPNTTIEATDVPTDRGFWIEDGGQRLFAVIIDPPGSEPPAIEAGSRIRITDGTFRSASNLGQLEGEPLDDATLQIAENQPIVLVVEGSNIQVMDPTDHPIGEDSTGTTQPQAL